MEPTAQDLGKGVNPETGMFIVDGSDQDTEQSFDKAKFLNFHAYEAGWMQNPQNEALYNDMRREYEQSPPEAKLLADTADATVEGISYYGMLKEYAGPEFYTLRTVEATPTSLVDKWQNGSADVQPVIGDGYHKHGNRYAVNEKFWDFVTNFDAVTQLSKRGESIEQFATSETEFTADDIADVKQFATAFVVLIKPESWKQKVEDPAGTPVDAFYRDGKSTVYAKDGSSEAEIMETCKHEYSHMLDAAIRDTLISGNLHGEKLASKYDNQLFIIKSEISAYLEDPSAPKYEIEDVFQAIKAHMEKGGYETLMGTPEEKAKFDRLFELVSSALPFIKSLIEESGLDPNDRQTELTFMKTFLAMLPNRAITYKMLERVKETGLYNRNPQNQDQEISVAA